MNKYADRLISQETSQQKRHSVVYSRQYEQCPVFHVDFIGSD